MQSVIRFSVFGNYERFNTNNFEIYMKLIEFFGKKGYKPATANELQLQPNGQARVLIMPSFFNESNSVVEITSNRINFQKTLNEIKSISELREIFNCELEELLRVFVNEMGVMAGRVALNCEIVHDHIDTNMPTQSNYYDCTENTEMAIKNVTRKNVEDEACNIILEKHVNTNVNFTKYVYDINSLAENQMIRFNADNIKKMYGAFVTIADEIEKGLK